MMNGLRPCEYWSHFCALTFPCRLTLTKFNNATATSSSPYPLGFQVLFCRAPSPSPSPRYKPIMISAHRPRFPADVAADPERQARPHLVNAAKTRIENKMTNRPVYKGCVQKLSVWWF